MFNGIIVIIFAMYYKQNDIIIKITQIKGFNLSIKRNKLQSILGNIKKNAFQNYSTNSIIYYL